MCIIVMQSLSLSLSLDINTQLPSYLHVAGVDVRGGDGADLYVHHGLVVVSLEPHGDLAVPMPRNVRRDLGAVAVLLGTADDGWPHEAPHVLQRQSAVR